MNATTALLQELLPRTASKTMAGADELHVEPIFGGGHPDGLLVELPLERVAVFTWRHDRLSLSQVGRLRRATAHALARRAIVYVRQDAGISSAAILLATLSKIEIVRLAAGSRDLHPPQTD